MSSIAEKNVWPTAPPLAPSTAKFSVVVCMGLKDLCCVPQNVESYKTGRCFALENTLIQRVYRLPHPSVRRPSAMQGLQGR